MNFAILFPGQGSQYIGMCKELIKEFSTAADVFKEANSILKFDIYNLIQNGSLEELTLSRNAQPAVVTASYALFKVFIDKTGLKPFCAAGHSLGEISALIAAGSLSFSEGLLYVRKRGKMMHKAIKEQLGGAGIVLDIDVSVLENIIDKIQENNYITISGYNSPRQFVVAGSNTALIKLDEKIDNMGGEFIPFRMIPMKADAPYHSGLMKKLKCELEEILQRIEFKKPNFDIYSTVTGNIIKSKDIIKDSLKNQLVLPVCWNQVVEKICSLEVELLIDIGPQKIIRNMIEENISLPVTYAFDNKEDRTNLFKYIERRMKYDVSKK